MKINLDILKNSYLDLVYPIGSIYMSVNSTNPATLFGGTWEQIEDTFLLGSGENYNAGDTGGSATHQHKLPFLVDSTFGNWSTFGWNYSINYGTDTLKAPNRNKINNTPEATAQNLYQPRTQVVSNMPPYLVVYMWKRVE